MTQAASLLSSTLYGTYHAASTSIKQVFTSDQAKAIGVALLLLSPGGMAVASFLAGRFQSLEGRVQMPAILAAFGALSSIPKAAAQVPIGDPFVVYDTTNDPAAVRGVQSGELMTTVFQEGGVSGSVYGITRNFTSGDVGDKFLITNAPSIQYTAWPVDVGAGWFIVLYHNMPSSSYEIAIVPVHVEDIFSRTIRNSMRVHVATVFPQVKPRGVKMGNDNNVRVCWQDRVSSTWRASEADVSIAPTASAQSTVAAGAEINTPSIAVTPAAYGFVWQYGENTGNDRIFFRPRSRTTETYGSTSQISPSDGANHQLPEIIGTGNRFITFWQSQQRLFYRLLEETGTAVGNAAHFDSGTALLAARPSVTVLPSGNVPVTWGCGDRTTCVRITDVNGILRGQELMGVLSPSDETMEPFVIPGDGDYFTILARVVRAGRRLIVGQLMRDNTNDIGTTGSTGTTGTTGTTALVQPGSTGTTASVPPGSTEALPTTGRQLPLPLHSEQVSSLSSRSDGSVGVIIGVVSTVAVVCFGAIGFIFLYLRKKSQTDSVSSKELDVTARKQNTPPPPGSDSGPDIYHTVHEVRDPEVEAVDESIFYRTFRGGVDDDGATPLSGSATPVEYVAFDKFQSSPGS